MELEKSPTIGIKPMISLKRHFHISILAWIVVVILGLPVVFIKGAPEYTAEAVFQVAPRYMKNLQSDPEVEMQSNSQYREFVNHLSKTVTRYDVLQKAIQALAARGVEVKPPKMTERKYIERLQKDIYVRAIADTYMVSVGLDVGSDDKLIVHELINAVMASFIEISKTEQIYGSGERLNVLQDTGQKLQGEISEMEVERVTLGQKLGLTTFTDNATNPYDSLLAQARQKTADAEIERTKAKAIYQAFITQKEVPSDLGRSLLQIKLEDLGLQAVRVEVNKRVEELTQSIAGLEEKHPARGPATAEIKMLKNRLKAQEDEFDRKNFENYRARFQSNLDQKTQIRDELQNNLKQLEGQASEFARNFQRAIYLTKQIEERQERLKQIDDRLSYLETESNALGFVRLVTPAMPADTPKGLGHVKLLLAVIVAAFGAGLVLPIMIDMMDRRIRSVAEAENLLGIPSAGWQLLKVDEPTRQFALKQTRRFVSALIRTQTKFKRKVFAFTSVKANGGATQTILDSATDLIELGFKVLVVEANTFTAFSGFDQFNPGLSDFLSAKAQPSELIHKYDHQTQTLDVIGIGAVASFGLQRLDRLQKIIQVWSDQYDYILFDLPPILLSADTEMLIEILGQVFLVVEAESVIKGEIMRAKRLLMKIEPEAVGLFVNKVPVFDGGGYMQDLIQETLTRSKSSTNDLSSKIKVFTQKIEAILLKNFKKSRVTKRFVKQDSQPLESEEPTINAEPKSNDVEIDSIKQVILKVEEPPQPSKESVSNLTSLTTDGVATELVLGKARNLLFDMQKGVWDPKSAQQIERYIAMTKKIAPNSQSLQYVEKIYAQVRLQHGQS
jgi:Mrp family chromosome partitioning ATPase/capsular polysaccharide biosynthesis protein